MMIERYPLWLLKGETPFSVLEPPNTRTNKPHLVRHLNKKEFEKRYKENGEGEDKDKEDRQLDGEAATGKLYDFSSSSMEDTLTRYVLHSNNVEKPVQPCLKLQNYNREVLRKNVSEEFHKLRQIKVEYLEGLNMKELGQLEKKLEAALSLVIKTEEERALNEIHKLQRKEARWIKLNKQLKQEIKMMNLRRGKSQTVDSEGDNAWMMILIPEVRLGGTLFLYEESKHVNDSIVGG
ncbi:hypothetical protein NL676_026056 [Syzygium grande]|nr:hypothetical protein NL676_026056 [Syzygium grande]